MKRLNWSGWAFTMAIIMLGATANENVKSIIEWLFIVLVIGLPLSLFPLIAGRKKLNK